MYPHQQNPAMGAPQKPETFMLSNEAQQALPHDAQVALQQVDNREFTCPTFTWPGASSTNPPPATCS